MCSIGEKLRILREKNNLTRKEAVIKLHHLGIDISDKTLYGYESGRNSANADMFLALCRIYNCRNIASEFSDTMDEILEKYRTLDNHGKEMVDLVLTKEWERSTDAAGAQMLNFPDQEPEHLISNAAHLRTDIEILERVDALEDSFMDNENF